MHNQDTKEKDIMKKRLLLLQKYFVEKTDEEHQVDTFTLLKFLEDQKIPTNRKTLRADIKTLAESGMDIVTIASKPNKYFLGERGFELPELKLLVDAVASSRFITEKKSKDLIKKLSGLASRSQQGELQRNIYPTNRAKSTNETSYYVVDAVNEAINRRKKISFKYYDYDVNKKKFYRHDGEEYILSPYALIWNEDFYYVLGLSDKSGKIVTFRTDRIREAKILDIRSKAKPKGFKVDDYAKQTFEMYEGEVAKVKLECKANLMRYVVDRFGEKVNTTKIDDDRFMATVDVMLSPVFFGWVFQFGGDIKIKAPKKAVNEFKNMQMRF